MPAESWPESAVREVAVLQEAFENATAEVKRLRDLCEAYGVGRRQREVAVERLRDHLIEDLVTIEHLGARPIHAAEVARVASERITKALGEGGQDAG